MFHDDPQKHNLKHNPFKALVAPRPIAWISSIDPDGVANLAPFSFFNAISENPPMVVFAPNGPGPSGSNKDTLRNIQQTNEFVVNLSNWNLRQAMNASSAAVGPEVDEFVLAGVTAAPSIHVKPPRVKEAPASLECRFLSRICLPCTNPNSANNLVIGEVVGIHIDDAIIQNGLIDTAAYQPLARHGYMDYSSVDSVFEMIRPTV